MRMLTKEQIEQYLAEMDAEYFEYLDGLRARG